MLYSRDWEILCVLAECKNITRAAHQLFISQPALTKRIMQMEEELNTKLVERSVTGVILTPQGELLVEYARTQRDQYEKLQKSIGSPPHIAETLRIGSVSAIAQFVLPDMLSAFNKEYPELSFEVHCDGNYDIAEKVHSQKYHIGFVRDKQSWNVDSIAYHEDFAYLVSSYPIDLKRLPDYPNISIITDKSSRRLIQTWWYDIFSRSPNTIMTLTSANESIEMIRRGLGYGILIDQNFFLGQKDLVCEKLYYKSGSPVSRRDYLIFRNRKYDSSPKDLFLSFAEKYFQLDAKTRSF